MSNLLLLEDCEETGILVSKALQPNSVTTCQTIASARQAMSEKSYDLIIIDVELPDGNGYDFCSELVDKIEFNKMPKIILSARDQVTDRVFGLYSGADDYICKPFAGQELRARVETCLRRVIKKEKSTLEAHCFQFDFDFAKCYVLENDQKVDLQLTPTEYRLLLTLVTNEGRPFTRHDMVREIWNTHGLHIETRGIDSHISHLRKKLGKYRAAVASVYGKGYVFQSFRLDEAS